MATGKLDTSNRIAFIGTWKQIALNQCSPLKIIFLLPGGGNMASAIIGGLLANGYPATNIIVSEPMEAARVKLSSAFGVHTTTNNADAVAFTEGSKGAADLVMLAVKPQIMKDVAHSIAEPVQTHKPVVVTIAAGIVLTDLAKWLSEDQQGCRLSGAQSPALVRVMPNTPALVSEGATGLFATTEVSEEQRSLAFNILGAVSKSAYWVDREELLDVVTGLSGKPL